ncbi:MAG: PH domain-containing protein [Oleiphilaceae bacterium]|nr:PH domain-containing protein [Oleiphilaceae bacterium]
MQNPSLPPHELPTVARIPWQRLHPRYPLLSLIASLTSWLLGVAVAAGLMLGGVLPLTWLGFTLLALLLLLPALMAWPAARAKRFAVRRHDVLFREGLLWRSMTALPRSRIQHIETQSGPLERAFGMMTLRCYGAGGQQADLAIPGLEETLCQRLRQHLLEVESGEGDYRSDPPPAGSTEGASDQPRREPADDD